MKIKDLERTANVCWSPKSQHPVYLAAGTAAQQLDASFDTNACLELYSLNLSEPGPDLKLVSTASSPHRFHKLIWSDHNQGTIVAGCDSGLIQIYNAQKLIDNQPGLIGTTEKHTGSVSALDFNPFQANLFATGATQSEIFIWDLNNTSTPMSPGAKSQPLEDVLSVSWNRQVQHILASTFSSKCVIWDLRKNEPIIKLTDTVSRIRWKNVAWHPEVATQLCLASEDDHSPIIQLWDLRFATSPLKTLENHQRGVLSVAWCIDDPDLLLSCGKDNRLLCWNPNSQQQNGEVLAEVAKTNQWCFDIAWCPRNPAIVACPNFDGHVAIYSLMGGKTQQIQTSDKIADSFPGMDGYVQAPVSQTVAEVSSDLTKPPKWLRKPCRASFGFGGKLISFSSDKPAQDGLKPIRSVQISQVVTEPQFVQKSQQLEQAVEYGNFTDYCKQKADSTDDQHIKYIWHYLKAQFEPNSRAELLNLLGYRIEDINGKLSQFVGNSVDQITERLDDLNTDPFSNIGTKQALTDFKIKTGDDTEGLITQAILLNNVEAAVELCIKSNKYADALIIATAGGPDLLAKTQARYLEHSTGYVSELITAMMSENWAQIVQNCAIDSWKEALAAVLTHSGDDEVVNLSEQLGHRLESEQDPKLQKQAQLCYICAGSFDKLVQSWQTGTNSTTTDELQDLVELVTFLQKAVERQGRQVQVTGSLADLLSNYAGKLAAQGELTTALAYLGNSTNERVSSLRDRLYVSLGQKPAFAQDLRQQARRGSNRTSFTSTGNQYGSVQPLQPTLQPQQQPIAPPIASFPPPSFSPGPPSSTSGRKYVLDPSVAANNYGIAGRPLPAQPIPNFAQPLPSLGQPVPNYAPIQPTPSFAQPQDYGTPFTPSMPVAPPPLNTESAQYVNNAPPGWNDPPILNKPLKSQQQPPKSDLASEPITHPIFGQAPPTNNGYGDLNTNAPPPMGAMQPLQPLQPIQPPPTMYNPPLMNNNNINGAQTIYGTPAQQYNPNGFNQNAVMQPQLQQQQQQAPPTPPPSVPIQKAPIPEEHLHMQTVFDELKTRCSCASNNAQTKRKLEDVGRKLEALYDMLREHKLSANTLQGLHQMVQMVQDGNYTGGLGLHTQLVSGPDFAKIASFMPGLKVLLQCALTLQVYLR